MTKQNYLRQGKVEVNDDIVDVFYKFVDEDTILCYSTYNKCKIFYTHYKSLIV